jgi:hypothetical protein
MNGYVSGVRKRAVALVVTAWLLSLPVVVRADPAQKPAYVEIVAPDGAAVTLDGRSIGAAPLGSAVEVKPGDHEVQALIDGTPRVMHIVAEAGATARASFLIVELPASPPSPSPSAVGAVPALTNASHDSSAPHDGRVARWWASGSIAGAAAVSAGVGVGFALASDQHAATASQLRSQLGSSNACFDNTADARCTKLAGETQAQHTDFVASRVLYGVGVGLGATAVAVWLLWPSRHGESSEVTVTPAISGRETSITIGSRF